jgi:hypothetical protein
MKQLPLIVLLSLGMASAAFAQTTGGITMSTDPAKAAAVERHAAELKARPAAPEAQAKPTAKTTSTHKTKAHAKQPKASAKPAAKPVAAK